MAQKVVLPEIEADRAIEFRIRLLNLFQTVVFADYVTISASGTTVIQLIPSVLLCNAATGNQTLSLLPVSQTRSVTYFIKKIDSSANTVTINPDSADLIDGAATLVLSHQYDSVMIVSDTTQWRVLADGGSIGGGGGSSSFARTFAMMGA